MNEQEKQRQAYLQKAEEHAEGLILLVESAKAAGLRLRVRVESVSGKAAVIAEAISGEPQEEAAWGEKENHFYKIIQHIVFKYSDEMTMGECAAAAGKCVEAFKALGLLPGEEAQGGN